MGDEAEGLAVVCEAAFAVGVGLLEQIRVPTAQFNEPRLVSLLEQREALLSQVLSLAKGKPEEEIRAIIGPLARQQQEMEALLTNGLSALGSELAKVSRSKQRIQRLTQTLGARAGSQIDVFP